MADDTTTPVVSDDSDIEDVSLVNPPIAPADAPSEPADEGKDEAADTQDKSDNSASEGEGTTPKEQEPAQEPETQPDEAAPSKEEQRVRAAQEYQNRQRTRQQIQQQIDQTYGFKTEEELIQEGLNQNDARFEALRQELAYKEQRAQITEMNANLQIEAVNVFNDYPVYNPKSKDYDPEFTQRVENAYKRAARLQTDEQGIVLNAEEPLYDFYKEMADAYTSGATKGSEQQQRANLDMLSNTESVGSSSTTSKGGNTLADLEERLGDVVIT
jgi:hypothetical protein